MLICFMIFNIILVIYMKKMNEKIVLKEEYKRLEYGEQYNPKLDDLIDVNKFSFFDTKKVSIESNMVMEENQNYAKVGKYNISVLYKDLALVQVIEVIDRTAPELIIQEIIEIDYNTELSTYDFRKYIKIFDLSELKNYTMDLSKVNSSISGEYEASISIEDIYNNKTEKQFKIKILEKIEEVEGVKEIAVEKKDEELKKKSITSSEKSETEIQKNSMTISEKNENNCWGTKESDISNNLASEEKKENNNKETEYTIVQNPNKCTHGDRNYYDTREEAIAVYKNKVRECSEKLKTEEIKTYEEYIKVCPYGYEDWSCPYCGKWTIKMYYR